MNKRRSHNKSRKGCTNCKQRHVKCDEQGPPCAACVARDTTSTCVYGTRKSTTPSTPGSTDIELSSQASIPESIQEADRRLLELRLMHRWMTHTWKCCHGMDEDVEFLQELMPQASLKFSYLLYSMLSICAIDIAIHGEEKAFQTHDPMFYVETALHYFNLSSQALRLQLGKTDPEAHLWVYMASIVLTMIQMAIPQCLQTHAEGPQPTMIERMGVVIELFMGNGKVALLDPTALYASPGAGMMHKATALISGPPPDDIPEAAKLTMENMEAVVNSASSPDSELIFPAYHDSYVKVMGLLKLSFMEDARGQLKGMCVSVPMFCGREFCSAVNEAQPTALYLLMILGALVEKGAQDGYWWANTIGSGLVQETSEILAKTQPHLMLVPEWQGGIAWARAEVGLPVLV